MYMYRWGLGGQARGLSSRSAPLLDPDLDQVEPHLDVVWMDSRYPREKRHDEGRFPPASSTWSLSCIDRAGTLKVSVAVHIRA